MSPLAHRFCPKAFVAIVVLTCAGALLAGDPVPSGQATGQKGASAQPPPAGGSATTSAAVAQPGKPKDAQGHPGPGAGASRSSTGAYGRNDPNPGRRLDHADYDFVERLASEVETDGAIAEMGVERATDVRVRALAEKLRQEHAAARTRIAALAKDVNVPIQADLKSNRDFRNLKREKDRTFDREFVDLVLQRNKRDLKRVEVVERYGKNPEIREFASTQAEVLRRHIDEAETLRKELRK